MRSRAPQAWNLEAVRCCDTPAVARVSPLLELGVLMALPERIEVADWVCRRYHSGTILNFGRVYHGYMTAW